MECSDDNNDEEDDLAWLLAGNGRSPDYYIKECCTP
jgi:hypothetical protein